MSEFYVYLHCRPSGEPFYVGKGKNCRSHDLVEKRAGRSLHHQNVVAKYGVENIRIIVIPCISEVEAFRKEVELISAFRNAGIGLVNKTIGGDGPAGCIRSPETRMKISSAQIGRKLSTEHKANISVSLSGKPKPPGSGMSGHRHTKETKLKMSESAKRVKHRPHSEETRRKMSLSYACRKTGRMVA